ncbi:MAG: four-carbon acid sugar kinase family protein [Terracoccus sp.]
MTPLDQPPLQDGLLVSWYGDDFTGSAAVMEAMTFAGLPSVLFLDVPDAQMLARFTGYRGIGVAGVARSRSPEWMGRELPRVFDCLALLGAPISHYKVCSTLDSAPHVGSIGVAADLAIPVLGGKWHPLVLAAPAIGRYQAFGNLFAVAAGGIARLDRHPTMSRHPITPMSEADVRVHLGRQTDRCIGLVDLLALADAGSAQSALRDELTAGAEIVALDVVDDADLAAIGRLIWTNRGERLLAIGSQGLEYALIAHWMEAGVLARTPNAANAGAGAVEHVVVVSGSCSSDTASQIRWAKDHGFRPIRAQVSLAADERAWQREIERLGHEALLAIGAGCDPIVFTAAGPDDPAIGAFKSAIATSGASEADVHERVGSGLGRLLGTTLSEAKLKRGIIAGGDTSGYGVTELRIDALTALAPTVPGAALLKAHARDPVVEGMEIALKGGQMGTIDYFQWIKEGGGASRERSGTR